jgi:hypothetical protein
MLYRDITSSKRAVIRSPDLAIWCGVGYADVKNGVLQGFNNVTPQKLISSRY